MGAADGFDWRGAIAGIAPTLGGLLATVGGPAGMLGGAAITAIGKALGTPASEDAIAQAVKAGLSPEQQSALIAADKDIKLALVAADVRKAELSTQEMVAGIADIADARSHNAQTLGILILGYSINAMSYFVVSLILYGCFYLISKKAFDGIDPGLAASVGTLVGGISQWILSNAAQANAFFFGSSPTSRQVTSDLAKATASVAKGK